VRVVLSRNADLPLRAKMLRNLNRAPVWVVHAEGASEAKRAGLAALGVQCLAVPVTADGAELDIEAVARALAERGITRLLVEGGPTVAASFLRANLVDEAVLFHGASALDSPALRPIGLDALAEPRQFHLVDQIPVGADMMTVYRRAQFWQS
jgi:diaminohydroxyphosphoribosylaminopyrimidine deaminase/5-amino-6-(5-phosphoribosylamino)uracil reductase